MFCTAYPDSRTAYVQSSLCHKVYDIPCGYAVQIRINTCVDGSQINALQCICARHYVLHGIYPSMCMYNTAYIESHTAYVLTLIAYKCSTRHIKVLHGISLASKA